MPSLPQSGSQSLGREGRQMNADNSKSNIVMICTKCRRKFQMIDGTVRCQCGGKLVEVPADPKKT
jgi:DNA-directed RNA polymerase subunit RPC12/RpoP